MEIVYCEIVDQVRDNWRIVSERMNVYSDFITCEQFIV